MWIFIIAAVVIFFTFRWFRSFQKIGNYDNKYVLITGCDTGFGNMLSKKLDGLGFHVFAGCLSEKGMKELDAEMSPNVTPVCLDVSKTESIQNALTFVKTRLPDDKGLWGLVNNAGIVGAIGPSQWLTRDDYKTVYEVNTLGTVETTRIFLPLLLKSKGRIVNMTSIMGRIAAGNFPYVLSKFAAEGYADNLRRELYKRGVTVHIIEPGFFRTSAADINNITSNMDKQFNRLSKEMQEYFGTSYINGMKEKVSRLTEAMSSSDTHLVVDAYTHALTAKYPRYRYLVGRDAKILFRTLLTLPEWMSDYVLTRGMELPLAERC